MSLQVRRLSVHLAAARDVAAVDVLLPQVDSSRTKPFGLLAVGTVAGGPSCVAPLRTRRWGVGDAAAGGAARALRTRSARAAGAAGVMMQSKARGTAW